jgi:two-component system NarL family sensor kinase
VKFHRLSIAKHSASGWALPLKFKLSGLLVATLFVALATVGVQVSTQSRQLAQHQRELLQTTLLTQKRIELVRAITLMRQELEANISWDAPEALKRATVLLMAAAPDQDTYFFLYDLAGRCLVHPKQPELVGQNLQALVDDHGRRVIPSLIETARNGGGFQQYSWRKPSTGRISEKLGYVTLLEPWGWVLGSGVYLDDIESAASDAHSSSETSIAHTLRSLGLVALAGVLAVFVGGLVLTVTEQRLADRKLRAMADRVLNSQEDERARVALELHDGIVQVLVATRFLIEASRSTLERDTALSSQTLTKALARLDEAIVDIRHIAHGLRPAILDELGLGAALHELAEETSARLGIRVQIDEGIQAVRLVGEQSLALLRVAQEALMNVERHARANNVTIQLSLAPERQRVTLRITDDGRGFDANASWPGHGLTNMRHRAQELGGSLSVKSRPGQTEILAELKLSS